MLIVHVQFSSRVRTSPYGPNETLSVLTVYFKLAQCELCSPDEVNLVVMVNGTCDPADRSNIIFRIHHFTIKHFVSCLIA